MASRVSTRGERKSSVTRGEGKSSVNKRRGTPELSKRGLLSSVEFVSVTGEWMDKRDR